MENNGSDGRRVNLTVDAHSHNSFTLTLSCNDPVQTRDQRQVEVQQRAPVSISLLDERFLTWMLVLGLLLLCQTHVIIFQVIRTYSTHSLRMRFGSYGETAKCSRSHRPPRTDSIENNDKGQVFITKYILP